MDWPAIFDALVYVAITIAGILAIVVPVLLTVAMMTIGDRKLIAAAQMRHGPNVTGPFGLLQPIADAIKLLFNRNDSKYFFISCTRFFLRPPALYSPGTH